MHAKLRCQNRHTGLQHAHTHKSLTAMMHACMHACAQSISLGPWGVPSSSAVLSRCLSLDTKDEVKARRRQSRLANGGQPRTTACWWRRGEVRHAPMRPPCMPMQLATPPAAHTATARPPAPPLPPTRAEQHTVRVSFSSQQTQRQSVKIRGEPRALRATLKSSRSRWTTYEVFRRRATSRACRCVCVCACACSWKSVGACAY
jgi:hypothetical protein